MNSHKNRAVNIKKGRKKTNRVVNKMRIMSKELRKIGRKQETY